MDKKLDEDVINVEVLCMVLYGVIDLEVGVNIVDFGLVYGVMVVYRYVRIDMIMILLVCFMGEMLFDEVEEVLKKMLLVGWEFEIELVWELFWLLVLMSEIVCM